MTPRWLLLAGFWSTAILVGVIGYFLAASLAHLYQDHLQVDQWRQEAIRQQIQQIQQSQPQQPQIQQPQIPQKGQVP